MKKIFIDKCFSVFETSMPALKQLHLSKKNCHTVAFARVNVMKEKYDKLHLVPNFI